MSSLALALRQVRYENRAFWRNPPAAFFTFAFPLIFLVILNLTFGNREVRVPGGTATATTFYVPAIVAMSVVNSCFTGLAMRLAVARDAGLLKRTHGTPLPTWAYLAGRVGQLMLVMLLLVLIVVVAGALVYDVDAPLERFPAIVLTLLVGTAAFAALGFAVIALIPNADAASVVVNAIVLPLLFISDIFIPTSEAPGWLPRLANLFPIRHLSLAMQSAFSPFDTGDAIEEGHLLMVALWGLLGLLLAVRFFSWEPRR